LGRLSLALPKEELALQRKNIFLGEDFSLPQNELLDGHPSMRFNIDLDGFSCKGRALLNPTARETPAILNPLFCLSLLRLLQGHPTQLSPDHCR
jgi:hypothetical protein